SLILVSLTLYYSLLHSLLSFPTRRSSDLRCCLLYRMNGVGATSAVEFPPVRSSANLAFAGHGSEGARERCSSPGEPQRTPVSKIDRKSTRLNSSHVKISYAVFCLKKKIEK